MTFAALSIALLLAAPRSGGRPPVVGSQPAPQATYSWRNVKIVAGGFVTGLLHHPAQRGLIYARTDMGGAYRWEPGERRWVPLLDWLGREDWNLHGIESLAIDPADPNRLYLACGTYTNEWGHPGAILRSNDQGRTFERTNLPFKMGGNEDGRSMGERLAVDPDRRNVLYLGTRVAGLWRSTDFGQSWARVESFPLQAPGNRIGIGLVLVTKARDAQPGTIYVGLADAGRPLWHSQDAGRTWSLVPGQPTGLYPHQARLAADGALVLTYCDGPGPNGVTRGAVMRFDPRSKTWQDITPVIPNKGGEKGFGYAGLAVSATKPGTFAVSTLDRWSALDDLFVTNDAGATWASVRKGATMDPSVSPYLYWGREKASFGWWIGAVAMDPFDDNRVMYTTGATIWGSDRALDALEGKPTRWTVRAEGIEQTAVLDLLSPPFGPHLSSGLGDIGGFEHWNLDQSPKGMRTNPLIGNVDSLDYGPASLMVRVGRGESGRHGALTRDAGKTWRPFAAQPPGTRGSGTVAVIVPKVAVVQRRASRPSMVWAPAGSVPFFSFDFGQTWQRSTGAPVGRVVADKAAGKVYAYDPSGTGLWSSDDGGATFAKAGSIPPQRDQGFLRVADGRPGHLWLPRANGLFRSTNGGRSFVRVANVSRAEYVGFGRAAPGGSYPAVYLAGVVSGVEGVFRSDDGGASWMRINDVRQRFPTMQHIAGDPRVYGRVYLGTNGRGVFVGEPKP